jgi:hypothetical protein
MKRFRLARVFGVFFLCGLLSSGASAARDWLVVTSEHFEMLSCTSERHSKKLLVELEQFREMFFRLFARGKGSEPRTRIVLFDYDSQFRPYKSLLPNGKTDEKVGGRVFPHASGVLLVAANEDLDWARQSLFWEYEMALVYSRERAMPQWLALGLAEVYSTFVADKDSVTVGMASENNVRKLAERWPRIELGDLFGVTKQSKFYTDPDQRGMLYARAWLFVHHQTCGMGGDYGLKLTAFNELLSRDTTPISEAFKTIYGMDYKAMERELDDYLRSGRYRSIILKIPADAISAKIKARPATGFEREFALLDLDWRAHERGNVLARAIMLSEAHPDRPEPWQLQAELAMREKNATQAQQCLERAAELGSNSSFVLVQAAKGIMRQIRPTLDYRMPDELCQKLRGWLDRALVLDPGNAGAYETLSMVEAYSGKIRGPVVREIDAARTDMSDPSRTLAALAIVRWRIKDYENSERIADHLISQPKTSPALKSMMQSLKRRIAKDTGREVAPEPNQRRRLSPGGMKPAPVRPRIKPPSLPETR